MLCLRSPWKGLEVVLFCFLVPWLASSTRRSLVAPRIVGPARGGPLRWRRRLGRLRLTSPGRGPPTRCTLSPLPGALAGGWHKHDCPSGTSSRPCTWARGVKQGEMVNPQAPCQLEARQMFPSPLTLTLLCPHVGQTEPALQWSRPHPGLCVQAGSCSPLALPRGPIMLQLGSRVLLSRAEGLSGVRASQAGEGTGRGPLGAFPSGHLGWSLLDAATDTKRGCGGRSWEVHRLQGWDALELGDKAGAQGSGVLPSPT